MKRVIGMIAALVLLAAPVATAQYLSPVAATPRNTDSSRGRDHFEGAKTGAFWGLGIGAGIGVLGAFTGDACWNYGNGAPEKCEPLNGTERVLVIGGSALLGGLAGAAIGAVIGKEDPADTANDRVQLQLAPTRAGMRVAF